MRALVEKHQSALISGLIVGVITALLTFGLNRWTSSSNELKTALDSKASIVYVDKCFSDHEKVSQSELEWRQNIQIQVNTIYNILLKGK
jgi:hypothetical protein